MANTYSENIEKKYSSMIPKKEIVDFLLQYSKSLDVIKSNNYTFEVNKN